MCFWRQFLRKMWTIQIAFLLFTVRRIFLSSALCNTSAFFTRCVQLIFSILLQHHISKLSRNFCPTSRRVQVSAPYKAVLQIWHFTGFFLKFNCTLLVKTIFLLRAAFAKAVLHLKSHEHLASFVIMLYNEITTLCSQIHTNYKNTWCVQKVELLNVKLGVHIMTGGF